MGLFDFVGNLLGGGGGTQQQVSQASDNTANVGVTTNFTANITQDDARFAAALETVGTLNESGLKAIATASLIQTAATAEAAKAEAKAKTDTNKLLASMYDNASKIVLTLGLGYLAWKFIK